MRVVEDAEVWLVFLEERSSFLRQLPTFVQNMTDGDATASQFDHDLVWKSGLFIRVNIAGDSGDWCDLSQLFEHGPMQIFPARMMRSTHSKCRRIAGSIVFVRISAHLDS